ncbi:MAG: ATP synthase delta/epsilon chain alpha-helix domain-containing protein [Myxococcota bacterium]
MGELGVLPGHRALITSSAIGQLSWVEGGSRGCWLPTRASATSTTTRSCAGCRSRPRRPDEIDAERAKKSLEAAEAHLKTIDGYTEPVEYKQAQNKRARALNRLAVARFATPEALRAGCSRREVSA